MTERYKIIPEVFLILEREGKTLLSRRFNTGYNDGYYGLPAGHGEEETMREGTAREAKEEIGLEIDPKDLELAHVQHRWCDDKTNPHARVGFYFVPTKFSGEPENKEPDKCDDLQWFPLDQLPSNMVPHVREALRCYSAKINYSEFEWDKK